MDKKERNQKTAEEILAAVGGKDNVTSISHCMTRLRINVKDVSKADLEKIQGISGVLGAQYSGGQPQVILGQEVDGIYNALCKLGNFEKSEKINENLDAPKKQVTFKSVGNSILDALSGCLVPLIPVLLVASMFKLIVALFGPSMLGWMSPDSDLSKLFTFVGDAGFYFVPVIVGYTAAKKFGSTPVLGILLGAILIHPTLIQMATDKTAFSVYGIPASVQNYSSTVLPIILSVWIMSYVEKLLNKYVPSILKTVFVPALTIAIMLPISLIVLGPAGAFLGNYIGQGLLGLSNTGAGFLAVALIAVLWEFLIMSGMHMVLISQLILVFFSVGKEALVLPAACVATYAVGGMCLGAALRLKNKEHAGLAYSYTLAELIGGVTEPGLYGVGIRYKRPFLGLMIGAFIAGLYAGIVHLTAYTLVPVASVLGLMSFAGGPTANFVQGIVSGVLAFVIAAIATYIIGFKKDDPLVQKQG
jgi:PTS system beta-glucosides-specific IIC component